MSTQPQAIAQRIQYAIQRGEFSPDEPLPSERALAGRWKLSRSMIREGIAMLIAKGILTRRQGLGTFINPLEDQMGAQVWANLAGDIPHSQEHLLEFRGVLEWHAAQLAAARHTKEDRKLLTDAGTAVDKAWSCDNRKEQLRTDLALHQCIARATHNPVFIQLMLSLHRLLLDHLQLSTAGHHDDPDVMVALRAQHRELVRTILARDAKAAARAAEAHLDFVRVRLNHLKPRGET